MTVIDERDVTLFKYVRHTLIDVEPCNGEILAWCRRFQSFDNGIVERGLIQQRFEICQESRDVHRHSNFDDTGARGYESLDK